MKHLASLTETSMYKALTDQHEAVTLSNEQNIFQMINTKLKLKLKVMNKI